MKKRKKKDKGKGGCWLKVLVGIIGIVLVVVVAIFLVFDKSGENKDERFETLINQSFEQQKFANTITNAHISSFNQKVKTAVKSNTQELFDSNNQLNTAVFLSSDSYFVDTLTLNSFEVACLYNNIFSQAFANQTNAENFATFLKIHKLSITSLENSLNYEAVIKIDTQSIASIMALINPSLPNVIYLTISATINLKFEPFVSNVTMQINELTGEDNEYCLNKLLGAFDMNVQDKERIAYFPFKIIDEQIDVWNIPFKVQQNQFVFN